MVTDLVTYERKEAGFGLLTLNRKEKHNAISSGMTRQLKKYIQMAKEDAVKCLVLTGAGDQTFCAGGDLNELHPNLSSDEAFEVLYPMKEVLYELASFPVPTVCLLNGNAFGGGCELATACDFRYAKEDTRHGFIQTSLGILPGWGGGTLLYEKVKPEDAYQWLVEGKTYTTRALQQIGWLHDVISHDEWLHREKYFNPFTEKSKAQLSQLKRQYANKMSILSLSAEMNEEVRNTAVLWGSPEHKAAIEAFQNKKA